MICSQWAAEIWRADPALREPTAKAGRRSAALARQASPRPVAAPVRAPARNAPRASSPSLGVRAHVRIAPQGCSVQPVRASVPFARQAGTRTDPLVPNARKCSAPRLRPDRQSAMIATAAALGQPRRITSAPGSSRSPEHAARQGTTNNAMPTARAVALAPAAVRLASFEEDHATLETV